MLEKATAGCRWPVGAKNVKYLESKWCVYINDGSDPNQIASSMDYACQRGDCTPLNYGGPCSKLDSASKVSYAFNNFFQITGQDVESCDFNGMAQIVEKNASVGDCLFPIALESRGWRVGSEITTAFMSALLVLLMLLGL